MRRYLAWQRSPAGHIYMEARIFTPDSRRLILRSLPHGRSSRYLLCDLADGGSLRSIVDEPGAKAVLVSPDGKFVYYCLLQKEPQRLHLRRVNIDGTEPATIKTHPHWLELLGFERFQHN